MQTPLLIKASCLLIAAKTLVITALANAFSHASAAALAAIGITFALVAIGVAGLWVMRRWAPLLILAMMTASIWVGPALGLHLDDQWPLAGPYLGLALGLVILSPAAIYWKRMSWKFFDLPGSAEKGSAHAHR